MNIKLTARGVIVNGYTLKNQPTKEAIAEQLKYLLFGVVPESK